MANLASEKAVKKLSFKAKLGREQEVSDIRKILESDYGRRFVWRYLTTAGVFQTSFTGNSTTFFNEGRRDVGLKILADVMEAMPDAYIQMAKESQGKEETDQEEDNAGQ
jgi:hypothetical protein